MNLHDEIARVARELYEKSGYVKGRDRENWLDAERIVLSRHASQEIEEPEGEEPIIAEEGITEEVEGTELRHANQEKEEETTVMEEIEAKGPVIAREAGIAMKTEKIKPAKKAATKGKKKGLRKGRQRDIKKKSLKK